MAVCFFGEGALGQGLLYEVMNMAQLWKLPVIYVCENNLYNEYTHYSRNDGGRACARAPKPLASRPKRSMARMCARSMRHAARLVERARRGEGPAFLLCNTYRYLGHHVGDINRAYYRSKEEEEEWKTKRDPLKLLGRMAAQKRNGRRKCARSNRSEMCRRRSKAAVQFALNAPYPDPNEVNQDVYAER